MILCKIYFTLLKNINIIGINKLKINCLIYFRLVDLQKITNQPANFIKEILLDIATYNTSFPHKSMWELKPEYRNYKAEVPRNSTKE